MENVTKIVDAFNAAMGIVFDRLAGEIEAYCNDTPEPTKTACDSCKCDTARVKESKKAVPETILTNNVVIKEGTDIDKVLDRVADSFPRLSSIKPCDASLDSLCLIDYDIGVLEERVAQLKSASDLLRIAAGYANMTANEAEALSRIEKLTDDIEWLFGYVMKHELTCLPGDCEQ